MEIIPIKTRALQPPEDDLFAALVDAVPRLVDGDVVCISSKVVAIHEGRCVPVDAVDKVALYTEAADLVIPRPYWGSPLTVVHHTFLGASGIDESNGDGHLVLLPEDPFASAERLHIFLCNHFNIKRLGTIITDSRSLPFRYGAGGVALGWWGIAPLTSHIGTPDIFGRAFKYERSNLVDGLAAAANVVMGETNECQPVAILRDVPKLTFRNGNTKDELFSPLADDTFRVLYERWL